MCPVLWSDSPSERVSIRVFGLLREGLAEVSYEFCTETDRAECESMER